MAATLTAAIAVWLAAGVVVLGARRPGYRHRRHTISELGEVGAREQHVAAYALFLPVGLGAAAVAMLADGWGSHLVAGSLAVGYLVASAAPCDPGCPPRGSTRNGVHLLGGVVEYVGMAIGFAVLAVAEHPGFVVPAVVVAGAVVAGAVGAAADRVGLIQRVVEGIALLGLLVAVA